MHKFRLFAAAALVAATPIILHAQAREITGTVTVAGSGAPLADATVGLIGQQLGVRTNDRGEYRLRVPAGDVSVLVRAIGYKRVTLRVTGSQATADAALEKDVLQLEGVVVTGQATTVDRRNASTAIATISAEEMTRTPAHSVEGQLTGKVAGARIMDNGGAPGGGSQIQIRGVTSVLGQSDPLFVIDGVIVSNAAIGSGEAAITRSSGSTNSNQDQVVNRIADINPNDIENIEVLKSAAASAIYGSRATNGVVVITTKRGKSGQTRYNVTQRVGSENLLRQIGSRHFKDYAEASEIPAVLGGPIGIAAAQAACTPACPWYDLQASLYGVTSPSFETIISASGGVNNTRFFSSLNDKQETGILVNTGSRLTSVRLNLDQTVGERLTVSGGVNVTRNFLQRGLANNDNAGVSPIYIFGYTPALVDLSVKNATGHYPNNPFHGGGFNSSNPFETMTHITSNEEVWRQTGNVRANLSILSAAKNSVQLSYLLGLDRFQQEGYQYSPNYLQYELADGFPGTALQLNTSNYQFNQSMNVIWTLTPGWKWMTSAQTSVGGSYEVSNQTQYNLRTRNLTPTIQSAANGTDISISENFVAFRDQSLYLNEQLLLLDEKLSIAAGLRADRSSANGDRDKWWSFPKYSASYRFVKPFARWTSLIDEVKLRAAKGQSGNRPRYADRDLLYGTSGTTLGGIRGLVAPNTLGNPNIHPETMNETEYGYDLTLLNQRLQLDLTHYDRVIKDLLLTYPLPTSSGLGSQTINGGQISVHGIELGLTLIPVRTRNVEWTFRTTYGKNESWADKIPVPPFNPPSSGFGAAFGHARIAQGLQTTYIWGSAPLRPPTGGGACAASWTSPVVPTCTVADTAIVDGNTRHNTSFLNQVTWKGWSFIALVDWRNGGGMGDLTNQVWDEGQVSRDYTNPSPDAGFQAFLGRFRYSRWQANDTRAYVGQDGSQVKLRELTATWQAPTRWATLAKAREMRLSLSGRNLAIWSKYWSFDSEFNNFGNQNFGRFVDHSPYPPARQFFFSVDLGY